MKFQNLVRMGPQQSVFWLQRRQLMSARFRFFSLLIPLSAALRPLFCGYHQETIQLR